MSSLAPTLPRRPQSSRERYEDKQGCYFCDQPATSNGFMWYPSPHLPVHTFSFYLPSLRLRDLHKVPRVSGLDCVSHSDCRTSGDCDAVCIESECIRRGSSSTLLCLYLISFRFSHIHCNLLEIVGCRNCAVNSPGMIVCLDSISMFLSPFFLISYSIPL